MLLDELMQAEKRSVGVKQAEKAVAKSNAAKVFIAEDADERITRKLAQMCQDSSVALVKVGSMQELGKACGINVKAAAAVILKA